ncbi:MAG: hypothetical protein M3Q97_01635 [Bacteroidota bacterium]|nr:hypothetical protein [Bacteroidota bacterium]
MAQNHQLSKVLDTSGLFENKHKVLDRRALASPFSPVDAGVPDDVFLKQVSFSLFNQSEILIADYDKPENYEIIYQRQPILY